jgi:hypothetical protein
MLWKEHSHRKRDPARVPEYQSPSILVSVANPNRKVWEMVKRTATPVHVSLVLELPSLDEKSQSIVAGILHFLNLRKGK